MNGDQDRFSIKDVMIAAPCNVPWDSMEGSETVRHCHECKLNVFNISEMSAAEGAKLLNGEAYANGKLCLRLYRRADGTLITKDCPKGLQRIRAFSQKLSRIAAATFATLVAMLPAFAQDAKTGNKTDGTIKQSEPAKKSTEPAQVLGGMPMPRPEGFKIKSDSGKANCTAAQSYSQGLIEEKAGNIDAAITAYKAAKVELDKDPKHDMKFVKTVEKALAKVEKQKAKEGKKAAKS